MKGQNLENYLQQTLIDETLKNIIIDFTNACKLISNKVKSSALADILGSAHSENVQGEDQKKLDVISNDILLECCANHVGVLAVGSEEIEEPFYFSQHNSSEILQKYLVLFDPLDGSSNIDVNISIGTIFSILKSPVQTTDQLTEQSLLQSGQNQVCSGYVVYGPAVVLVFTLGNGVVGFTLDPETQEFYLTQSSFNVPEKTKEIAINASNQRFWQPAVQRYVEECFKGKEGIRGEDFNMRWVGSMVADVHRLLTRGGVFMYPIDSKTQAKGGRLRLMYEVNPMSFLIEQAGGLAFTGQQRVLDVQPQGLHQRIGALLGSKAEIERLIAYHQN